MRTTKEINEYIDNLKGAKPINGHILVLEAEAKTETEEKTEGGIVIPNFLEERHGTSKFIKVIVVGFNRGSGFLNDVTHGTLEFEVGDVCYARHNALVHRDCTINGKEYFCITPGDLVLNLGRVDS